MAGDGYRPGGVLPGVRETAGECGAALARYVDWDLEQVLAQEPGAPGLERADVVQPALWAVMVSLAAVWQAAGVVPDAVAGHSQGEIAAATVAGILSLDDAARVVALRSRALMSLDGHGGMVAVAEPVAAVTARLTDWRRAGGGGGQQPGCHGGGRCGRRAGGVHPGLPGRGGAGPAGPGWVCLAQPPGGGDPRGDSHRAGPGRSAPGGHPDDLRDDRPVAPRPRRRAPCYWYDSLRAPVSFHTAVQALAADGHAVFIEASPHPVLTAAIAQTLDQHDTAADMDQPVTVTETLRRDDGGPARFAASAAAAWTAGLPVAWQTLTGPAQRADLPGYAFQRQRYWPGSGAGEPGRAAGAGEGLLALKWVPVQVPTDGAARRSPKWSRSACQRPWTCSPGCGKHARACSGRCSDGWQRTRRTSRG